MVVVHPRLCLFHYDQLASGLTVPGLVTLSTPISRLSLILSLEVIADLDVAFIGRHYE